MRIVSLAVLMAVLVTGCDKLPFELKTASAPAEVAKAPEYSPNTDPARPEFEKALDLIHGFNWSDDQHVKASQFVEQMKRSYPDSPYPLIAEAEFQHRMWRSRSGGAPEHIRSLINKSFAKSRAIADAYVTLAKLDLDQDQIPSAYTNATKAFKLAPDKPEVRYVMARVAEMRKEFDNAEQHYRKYIELSGKPIRQSNIHFAMAEMFGKMKPPALDKADDAYQNAIKLDPEAPWKIYSYARFLLDHRGDYEGAMLFVQRSMQIMAHPQYRELMALALYAKWADGYANKWANYKPRTEQNAPLQKMTTADLKKIEQGTGFSVDNAFVELSRSPVLGYAVRALMTAKAVKNIDVKTDGPCGCTALIKAADADNLDLAKYLISNKANVNGTNASGETALSRFILLKNWEAVNYLLDKGARVNFVDKDGLTPLHLVFYYADGDIEGYRLLLARKADPAVPLPDGMTLLNQAVTKNRVDAIQLLIEHGADPNEQMAVKPGLTWSLVYFAAGRNQKDVLALLLKAGADPWTVADNAYALMQKNKPEIFQMLSDARAARPKATAAEAAAGGARAGAQEKK